MAFYVGHMGLMKDGGIFSSESYDSSTKQTNKGYPQGTVIFLLGHRAPSSFVQGLLINTLP